MKLNVVWGAGIGAIIAGVLIAWSYMPAEAWRGVLWGTLVSSILNLLGFFAVRHAFLLSFKRLLSAIVGGLLFRMIVMLASAFYIREQPSISIMWYLVSFIACFFAYQAMEIAYFYTRERTLSRENS